MLNFSRLFSSKFIFNLNLGPMSVGFVRFFYILFGIFLILALISHLITRQQEKLKNLPLVKLWRKLTAFFFSLGIIGMLLLFFRQQQVYFLSMPLLWYLWLFGIVIWLIFIIRWVLVKMRAIQKEIEEKKEKEKYLKL